MTSELYKKLDRLMEHTTALENDNRLLLEDNKVLREQIWLLIAEVRRQGLKFEELKEIIVR